MMIATILIGDFQVTLSKWDKVKKPDIGERTVYRLDFLYMGDTGLDYTQSLFFDKENEAVMAFAAWIACDEPHLINQHVEMLRSKLAANFLP